MPICVVHDTPEPADPGLIARLRTLSTAAVSDVLGEKARYIDLLPLGSTPTTFAGQAVTVAGPPGDNVALNWAIDASRDGEILVVAGQGFPGRALAGENVYLHAVAQGVTGLVIDGAIRDAVEIAAGPVPVHVAHVTSVRAIREGPGEVNGRIVVRGVTVDAGDVVVGDGDGVIVFPAELLAEAVEAGEARAADDERNAKAARDGMLNRDWVRGVTVVRHDS